MKEINSGELNRRIQIQEFVTTFNENGFEIKDWITITSLYAKVENTNGNRYFNAGSEGLKKNSKFTVRYNSILNSKKEENLRIVFNDKIFIIQYINDPDELHSFFEIVGEYNGCKT